MIPVILSGGSGSRLWPVSREAFPKQFCELLEESLFEKTIQRLTPLGVPWTITVAELKVLTERSLKQFSLPTEQVIYEPTGKNTAPAIALLCRLFEMQGRGAEVVGIFPADHLIADEKAFLVAVKEGATIAEKGEIVTLGIRPTAPATGYGYIETKGPIEKGSRGLRAVGFREKPNESTARGFLAKGNYFWNAGMFIFRVSKMAELMKTYSPDIWDAVSKLKSDQSNLTDVYSHVRALSIDYAVMERLPSHVMIPCDFEWSDLGSWDSVAQILAPRSAKEVSIVNVEGEENFVFPNTEKTYAFVGVKDLIVVDTPDALLIIKKGQSERVKEVVDALKGRHNTTATQHTFEVRPWGRFEVMRNTDDFKSKTIVVDPGAQLSYQSHAQRAEHWVIVKGIGEVILDGETIPVREGKHVYIPVGAKHRIRNTGTTALEFVEVQVGSYFGEEDIVRHQDDYKRS